MTRTDYRLGDYLSHIEQAIERINRYVEGMDERTFLSQQLIQDAVIRNFEIIGEASHSIESRYPRFVEEHPELPLAFAYQMRNALSHGYFTVDLQIVWRTIKSDLPGFQKQVQELVELISDQAAPRHG